jgi:hypothetical protein
MRFVLPSGLGAHRLKLCRWVVRANGTLKSTKNVLCGLCAIGGFPAFYADAALLQVTIARVMM